MLTVGLGPAASASGKDVVEVLESAGAAYGTFNIKHVHLLAPVAPLRPTRKTHPRRLYRCKVSSVCAATPDNPRTATVSVVVSTFQAVTRTLEYVKVPLPIRASRTVLGRCVVSWLAARGTGCFSRHCSISRLQGFLLCFSRVDGRA